MTLDARMHLGAGLEILKRAGATAVEFEPEWYTVKGPPPDELPYAGGAFLLEQFGWTWNANKGCWQYPYVNEDGEQ